VYTGFPFGEFWVQTPVKCGCGLFSSPTKTITKKRMKTLADIFFRYFFIPILYGYINFKIRDGCQRSPGFGTSSEWWNWILNLRYSIGYWCQYQTWPCNWCIHFKSSVLTISVLIKQNLTHHMTWSWKTMRKLKALDIQRFFYSHKLHMMPI
jgi:hypothetical protein